MTRWHIRFSNGTSTEVSANDFAGAAAEALLIAERGNCTVVLIQKVQR